jgi:hypothetical protein
MKESLPLFDKTGKDPVAINKRMNFRITMIIENNKQKLNESQLRIDSLIKKKHEIPTYVNHLSADGVTNTLTDFLERNTKNTNIH